MTKHDPLKSGTLAEMKTLVRSSKLAKYALSTQGASIATRVDRSKRCSIIEIKKLVGRPQTDPASPASSEGLH